MSARATRWSGSRRDWPAARSTNSLTRSVSSRDSCARSATSSPRAAGGSSSIRRSIEMFVRREVSGRAQFMAGVLDEAPLVLLGLGEPAQHAVEGAAEPRHLVASGDRHPDVEPPGAGHVLRGPGEPDEPPGDPARQPPADETGSDHDGAHQQHGALLEFAQQVLGVAELLRDLHRAPPVAERHGRHPVLPSPIVDIPVLRPVGRPSARRRSAVSSAPTGSGGWPRSTTEPPGPRTCTSVPLGRMSSSRGPSSGSAVAKSAGVSALCRTSSDAGPARHRRTRSAGRRVRAGPRRRSDRNPTRTVTAAATAANDTVKVVRSEDSRARGPPTA